MGGYAGRDMSSRVIISDRCGYTRGVGWGGGYVSPTGHGTWDTPPIVVTKTHTVGMRRNVSSWNIYIYS